jgi:dipeptidyl aminopeptidase/acylaminoacyl peptidase
MQVAKVSHAARAVQLLLTICMAGAPEPLHAQSARYDPRLQFRTLTTARFDIHYHQGEEDLAKRLARIAEDVAGRLDARMGTPRGRVHVILVDQSDQSNGWASVIPFNLIEVAAVPPASQSLIGNTDDWLRTVFTHEYTHVVHLEKSGGGLGRLRHVFGRLPVFYPNLALPDWMIEGIATHQESELTGRGRIVAGDFRSVLERATAAGRFAPLDRATGAVIDWPSGNSAYLYGGFFHEFLERTYGRESLTRLADDTARRLPYFGSRAFRRVYGVSLGDLWKQFETQVAAQVPTTEEVPARTRLTNHGFTLTSPVFGRDGRLFYSVANPHGFPALMELAADTGEDRHVARRYRGNRLAQAGDELIFDQLEIVNHVEVQSDLYAVTLAGVGARRLTREARAADPDVAPDGQTIVCTVQETGRRLLATVRIPVAGRIADPVPLVAEASTEFSSPRWSPDGRLIVAERRRLGGPSEIVIVDVETQAVRTIVSSTDARNTFPVWLPDGATVLFSSDRDGGPFTLFAVDVKSGGVRRVTGAGVGAHAPALSPDGRRLVFVGYSEDGDDLYSLPFEPANWQPATTQSNRSSPPDISGAAAQASGAYTDRGPYRPWSTLRPRFWTPVIETADDDVRIGASTAGIDALGRHVYWGTAAWAIDRSRPDLHAQYAYARWWPTLFASVSSEIGLSRIGELRSRELTVGAAFPVNRVRWTSAALAALFVSRDAISCSTCDDFLESTRTRSALRLGWQLSNARSYGYSVSREEGSSIAVMSELTRRQLGADANAGTLAADARHYIRAFPRHGVIATRVAAATTWGDQPLRRVFTAGGSGPQPGGFPFDSGAIALIRGFEESDLFGNHAAVVNLDYRFPISWVQRGLGTLPFFLRSMHGAVFADAGHAWDDRFRAADTRRSFGGELSFDTVIGYSFGLTVTGGVAWRRAGSGDRGAVVAFGRIGRAF